MESVLTNVSSKARKETLGGREYLVADTTLIVPGVLRGSKGALLYPADEVSKDPSMWNGMPLVGYHPTLNGMHISGRDPEVIERQGLGYFYRAKANGKLTGEAWFDVANTARFDQTLAPQHRIIPRLLEGKPIELSTGLFTENEAASGTFNGKPYEYIARNYRGDHVAVLPDQIGACSVNDGCGIGVNSAADKSIVQKFWDWLTGNSDPEQSGPECTCDGAGTCEKCKAVANAGKFLNPQSTATGKFKPHGSGVGKGEVHEAAQDGHYGGQCDGCGATLVNGECPACKAMPTIADVINANPEGCNQHTGPCGGGGGEAEGGEVIKDSTYKCNYRLPFMALASNLTCR